MNGPYRKRGLPELVASNLFADLGGDHRDTVFVAGSGRSGTTWLSGIVNHDNGYRFVFEPFDPERVPLCRNFARKQYLRPDDASPEYAAVAEKVLSGGLRDRWSDRFNRRLLARRRLVKDIRANLLLGWMGRRFPGMPKVLLLRHPCAVAASRLRLGWRDNLTEVLSQEQLVEDHLEPFVGEVPDDAFGRSVFLWCVENYVPLRQAKDVHVVFYERLLRAPESELASLFDFLGKDLDGGLVRSVERGSGGPHGWTERVSAREVERAHEILALFGLDRVYGEDAMPRPEGLETLSGTAR